MDDMDVRWTKCGLCGCIVVVCGQNLDDVDVLWMCGGRNVDDVDVLWICGGQNVDDVDVFVYVRLKMWMMWMFCGCEVTMPYLHIPVSGYQTVYHTQCPTYYHASKINSLTFMSAIGSLSIRGSGCFFPHHAMLKHIKLCLSTYLARQYHILCDVHQAIPCTM